MLALWGLSKYCNSKSHQISPLNIVQTITCWCLCPHEVNMWTLMFVDSLPPLCDCDKNLDIHVQIFIMHPTIRTATSCIVMAHPHTVRLPPVNDPHLLSILHLPAHWPPILTAPSQVPQGHYEPNTNMLRTPPPSVAHPKVMWPPFLVCSPHFLTSCNLTDYEVAWPNMPLHSHPTYACGVGFTGGIIWSCCRHESVFHLGFTGLVQLRDGLFQLFVGGKLKDWK